MSAVGNYDTSCMYSRVKNTSGGSKIFGFLPPHGRRLAANEEYSIFGDIKQAIIPFDRTGGRRNIIALEHALQRQDLDIMQTPAPILRDTATHVAKEIKLTGGVLGVIDPCWNTRSSLSASIG